MASNKELYQILGVDPSASDAMIRSAYERLIADNPEGSPLHDSIVQAYTVLSDLDSRAAYDITGKTRKAPQRRHTADSHIRKMDTARYILNSLFLFGAVTSAILFIMQMSGNLSTTPFYWVCGASLLIKVSEYILRLIP